MLGFVEAHAAGIVHRDLKPQNLFVTRRLNGTPLLKVLDFGIAKAFGPGAVGQMALTDSAAIIGSPLYMAPEQMRSARAAEVRSDIWALGVILYELLGGQLPFDGETVTEVCIRVVNEQPVALLELRPTLDPAIIAIVMRCLEKEPELRYHNVSALAAALEPFSRSAKQGGPVRPWRSFEDTQDSQGGGNPFAAGLALANHADATGPSTAVTIQTLPPIDDEPSEAERLARAKAGSTKVSAGLGGPPGSGGERAQPFVSTDVSWGRNSNQSLSNTGSGGRSFSTGMVAAMVVSVAAAAVVLGLFLGRGSRTPLAAETSRAATTSAPSVNASEIEAKAKAEADAKAKSEADAKAKSEAEAAAAPKSVPAPGSSAAVAARLLSTGKRGGAVAAKPLDPVAPAPAPAVRECAPAEPKSTDPVSPNGAPILH